METNLCIIYMNADKVLVDLGVIGQLKGADKLGVYKTLGEKQLIIDSGQNYMQGLYRWYNRCNRTEVLSYLWNIVSACEKVCTLFNDPGTNKTASLRMSLKKSIEDAMGGLVHLRTTYSNDSNTVSQLNLIHSRLEEACSKIIIKPSE
tara:strand:+ start:1886 stop:2329 length:444 start_codon:yes stop_codon:yes gene_type:complete